MLGQEICSKLRSQGKDYAILSRSARQGEHPSYQWDPYNEEIDPEALTDLETIIHLAGAGIADKKWTKERKQVIIDSRVKTAGFLQKLVSERNIQLKHFISASAINIHGLMPPNDHVYTESDPVGDDYIAEVIRLWEESADAFKPARVVKIRIGIVLSNEGGALSKIAAPVKFGVGAPLGSGKQWVPWIHEADVAGIFLHALNDPGLHGAYNAVAPEHATNKQLTKAVGKALKRPVFLPPVPGFLLKAWFGELAALVLLGNRASCEKLKNTGYAFKFPKLDQALSDIYQ